MQQNSAILFKPQSCTLHLQWKCQVKYPDKHKPPLQLNSDSTVEAGAPQHLSSEDAHLRRGRTALPSDEELGEQKFSGLLKISACFRKQVPHLHARPPASFAEDWVHSLLGTELYQASSGVNLFWTRGGDRPDSTVDLPSTDTEYNCTWSWRALPKCGLCFHNQYSHKNPSMSKEKQELLTWENLTFSNSGGTETAAKVPRLPDNYLIG